MKCASSLSLVCGILKKKAYNDSLTWKFSVECHSSIAVYQTEFLIINLCVCSHLIFGSYS
jgi:hypothetical protein